jgi:hypothetical protein
MYSGIYRVRRCTRLDLTTVSEGENRQVTQPVDQRRSLYVRAVSAHATGINIKVEVGRPNGNIGTYVPVC